MEFAGNLISKYKQIGNAVPVKLAEVVAKEIKTHLDVCINSLNRNEKVGV